MTNCKRAGRFFSRCQFEARYDLGAPDLSLVGHVKGHGSTEDVLMAARPKTYVHDICVRCGKVVQRPTPTTNPNRSGE